MIRTFNQIFLRAATLARVSPGTLAFAVALDVTVSGLSVLAWA
jgi:hypothetical protein